MMYIYKEDDIQDLYSEPDLYDDDDDYDTSEQRVNSLSATIGTSSLIKVERLTTCELGQL